MRSEFSQPQRARRATIALAVAATVSASVTLTAAPVHAISVDSVVSIGPTTGGQAQSPIDADIWAYTLPDVNGVYQIHVVDLDDPEGDVCLTCEDIPGGPAEEQNKGAVSFDPSGDYLIMQVEMATNPFPGTVGAPGDGWYQNIWMAAVDGNDWWELTDYRDSSTNPEGVLQPVISHDGEKVAWAHLYAGGGSRGFGSWELGFALLEWTSGTPSLDSVTYHRPNGVGGKFYELSEWSHDDTEVLFTSNLDQVDVLESDLYRMVHATGVRTQLTDTADVFEEFGSFSADDSAVVYMSSAGTGWDPDEGTLQDLETELWAMDADGSNQHQLTDYQGDDPDHLHIVTKMSWSPHDPEKVFHELDLRDLDLEPVGAALFEVDLNFSDPASHVVDKGTQSAGDRTDVFENDNSYLVIQSTTAGFFRQTKATFGMVNADTTPSRIDIDLRLVSTNANTLATIKLYNYDTAVWDALDAYTQGTSELLKSYAVTTSPGRFVDDDGNASLYVESTTGDSVNHTFKFDEVEVRVTP